MKQVNFDSLKNLKAPQSWIKNAINIPQTVEKEKPIPFFIRYSRPLAAVACLVLVCSVSLTIFLTQDRNVLPIDPNYSVTEATEETQGPTVNSTENKSSTETVLEETQNHTEEKQIEPTEKLSSNTDSTITNSNGTNGGAPYEESTEATTQKPTVKPPVKPTVKPATTVQETQAQKPTVKPTQKETVVPTVKPTVKPTERPNPPVVTPTVKPTTPKPTIPKPTTPEIVKPTLPDEDLPGALPITSYRCYGEIPIENMSSNKVYCKIFDAIDNLVGDSNLFSKEHRALVETQKDKARFGYDPVDLGLIKEVGTYRFVFYNENGDTLYEGYFDIDYPFEEFGLGAMASKDSGEKFYCFVFDPDGVMLGEDSELFIEEREATVSREFPTLNLIVLEYYPGKVYKITKLGIYTYAFYNEQGTLLFEDWVDINF